MLFDSVCYVLVRGAGRTRGQTNSSYQIRTVSLLSLAFVLLPLLFPWWLLCLSPHLTHLLYVMLVSSGGSVCDGRATDVTFVALGVVGGSWCCSPTPRLSCASILVSADGFVCDDRTTNVTAASDAGLGSSRRLSLLFDP